MAREILRERQESNYMNDEVFMRVERKIKREEIPGEDCLYEFR